MKRLDSWGGGGRLKVQVLLCKCSVNAHYPCTQSEQAVMWLLSPCGGDNDWLLVCIGAACH